MMRHHDIMIDRCGGNFIPEHVIFIDVEPRIRFDAIRGELKVHEFGCGVASWCRLRKGNLVDKAVLHFSQPWLFWSFLDECRDRNKSTWVFAHNIGYDLTLLGFWDWLAAGHAELVSCVLEDPPTIVTVRWGGRIVKFVDILNYWRLSISDLATGCGESLPGIVADCNRHLPNPDKCSRDLEVVERCMLKLLSRLAEIGCCSLRPTAASLSWGVYLSCFLPRPLLISSDQRARTLEREAYFGGRVWAGHSGLVRESVTALDVNSLYPAVMQKQMYPCRLQSRPKGINPPELKRMLEEYDGISRVQLSPGDYPFPVRRCGVLYYLPGGGEFTLAGRELTLALSEGQVEKIYETNLYQREDLFSTFVEHFYPKKVAATREKRLADAMYYKLILNSLHGKFGQRGRKWSPAPEKIAHGYYSYWWHKVHSRPAAIRCRSIAGHVEARLPGPEPRMAFPAIAGCITANARVAVDEDIKRAGSANILYSDTDSLHTLLPGFDNLARLGRIDNANLGSLRVVAQGTSAEYWRPQHYRVGDKFVCSSLKPTANEVSDGIYVQDAMMGVERSLETGNLDRVVVAQRTLYMNARSADARGQLEQRWQADTEGDTQQEGTGGSALPLPQV